ncbi:MAG: hypothetical protein HYW85_01725 [Deltaproteobacteria bacterium]|nr:hypothetical protein [Deltaproteobacteria bacterium]MBI3017903.1 hypothetical protein [Deltaproteobacteria bacterium]
MKTIKKAFVMIIMFGLLATQSGCIVGLATGNAPLALGGVGIWAFGYLTKIPFFALSGIALDADNPGRQDALNPLPMDEEIAHSLEARVEDLETYNSELNQIWVADEVITITTQKSIENKGLSKEELTTAATRMGLASGQELIDILQGDELSQENLQKFASAFEMSPKTAELYLKRRWAIKIKTQN